MQVLPSDQALREAVVAIAQMADVRGGRALMVGGSVRDAVLSRPIADVDLEIYGIAPAEVEAMLERSFRLDRVGQAFGILKLKDAAIDVSLPRRESKAGLGHKGFEVLADPHMSIADAAARRDFTINALAFDPLSGELHDPFGGQHDLEARVLRHTSPAFADDPLRVLRGMQFAARFDLRAAPGTVDACRAMTQDELPWERLMPEWEKLLLLGRRPSAGLTLLRDAGWLRHYPELDALVDCPQDPLWHPEGDVWDHTLHCLDAFAGTRTGNAEEDLIVGFGVLAHDFGKPATTARSQEGRWRALGHAQAGVAPTRSFLGRLTNSSELAASVAPLVAAHMEPTEFYRAQVGDGAIRRLARRVGRIDRLARVVRADVAGRPPLAADSPECDWLLERAQALDVADRAPVPILKGRHLMQLGLPPGPRYREILDAVYEAQLEGQVRDVATGMAHAATVLGPLAGPASSARTHA
ncbi:MAG: CCA tRNA nucleotidyltransferase [Gemmatimonadaceae bacterium]